MLSEQKIAIKKAHTGLLCNVNRYSPTCTMVQQEMKCFLHLVVLSSLHLFKHSTSTNGLLWATTTGDAVGIIRGEVLLTNQCRTGAAQVGCIHAIDLEQCPRTP